MKQDMCVPCGGGVINIRVGAIILKEGRFLMVGNDQAPYLYSVGGRIQFGETAEEAVVREVFEETGVRMEVDRLGFIQENYFIGDSGKYLGRVYYELTFFFYMKTPPDFEPVCRSFTEGSHEEYLEWIAPDEPRTIFPAFFRSELDPADRRVRHLVCDERFFLRQMTRADLEPLHALLSDPEVMRHLEPPFTRPQTEAFLETQGLCAKPRILAVEDKDQAFLGYVIFHDYDETAREIGWVLRKEAWGRGLAGLLTKQLIAMAAADGKGCVIECAPGQTATKRIAETNGFRPDGTRDGLLVFRRRLPQDGKGAEKAPGSDDKAPGRRILVLGCPGSGKSTLARRLKEKTGLPLIHLDNIWWRADRTHISRDEFDLRLEALLAEESWILDGDYSRTYEPRIRACDTVVFLDLPEEDCVQGVLERVGKERPDIPWTEQAPDPELLELVRQYGGKNRPALLALFQKYPEKRLIVLHSREEAEAWLAGEG